jgi:beta-glucanase (GH16 family)
MAYAIARSILTACLVAGGMEGASWAFGQVGTHTTRSSSDQPLERAPDGRRLIPTFVEDFADFKTLCEGGSRWRSTYGDGSDDRLGKRTLASNGEQQVYVDPCFTRARGGAVSPFVKQDQGLDLVADRAPAALSTALEGHPYTSGLITTQPSFHQTYGYFEMRARLPAGKGLWPAFWLLPADLSWPPEIDVMESIGDPSKIYATLHSKLDPAPGVEIRVPASADGFHDFAVAWDAKATTWYLDGREVARHATPADLNKPMFMLVNLAVGGHWPGAPDAATPFPARLSVRWVRAYRFAP